MPPLALASLLHRSLPWLSSDGRAVINTLACHNGRLGSAHALCQHLGLRNRFQLNRLLRREGLPSYEELAGWVCVFHWMLRADAGVGGGALRFFAGEAHMQAATCYRLVRRVTGRCWTSLRDVGTEGILGVFLRRTHPSRVHRRSEARRVIPAVMLWTPRGSGLGLAAPPDRPRRLPLTGGPHGLAVRGRGLVYITRPRAASVQPLDLTTGRFLGAIALGCTPTCVAFSPSGRHAYVSVQFGDEIAVIDTVSHAQTQSLQVRGNPFPLVVSQRGRTLFVATNEDRLYALSLQRCCVIGTLPLPATSHHLALHPTDARLYVSTRAGGSVLEIDTMRCELLRTFRLGGWPQAMAISPDGTMLYVANEQHGLEVVQLTTGRTIRTLEFDSGPVSLALNPNQRLLYAGLVHTGKIAVIDAASLTKRALIDTGGRPREIGFDGNGKVIVANETGWIDILLGDGRDIHRLDQPHPQPTAPVALSVS